MTTTVDPLERARALDAADPLAGFRDRFAVPDRGLVYLDGNSLGRPTTAAIERIAALGAEWANDLIRGWDRWLDLPLGVGYLLAESLLGARAGEVAMTDSTTVNLYRLAAAALDARRPRRAVAIARPEFPTDRYVVEGLARERDLEIRWIEADPFDGPTIADVEAVLDSSLALVVLSHVNYRSASIADAPAITRIAREAGALVVWDLSHSAGAVPLELEAWGVDLAVGCTYKYLNGGPGAPAYLYVRHDLQDTLRPPIQGWFAQRAQFEMGPAFERAAGIRGWLVGTPGILGLAAAQAGIEVVAEAGIPAIRAKGIALTEYALELHDAWLAQLSCALGSPRHAGRRGAHLAIRHPDARNLTAELAARRVIVDFREPDVLRLGVSPLTTTFEDVHRGIEALRGLLEG